MKATRLFLLVFIFATTACTGLTGDSRREGVSSSLVDYLYAEGEKPPPQPSRMPKLQLPLRIGVAFVPEQSGKAQGLSATERMQLLYDVKAALSGRDFIEEIAVIPEAYMRTGRGFSALEQTARLYDLNVMALVSYDQVANTAEKASSIVYWTIAGAVVVKGNKDDVQTFVDTAVFDMKTRNLLFRAPGVSEPRSSSTLVGLERDVLMAERKSFEQAMAEMVMNLHKELASLKKLE